MADLAESMGLAKFSSRDGSGNPLLEEDDALMTSFDDIQMILGADSDQGSGKLFVTSR
jgi:hypothetical protein